MYCCLRIDPIAIRRVEWWVKQPDLEKLKKKYRNCLLSELVKYVSPPLKNGGDFFSLNHVPLSYSNGKTRKDNMPELVKKTAIENGDLPKKYSKKELKKMSRVLKPLENILNEHYAEHIIPKYGDIAKKE